MLGSLAIHEPLLISMLGHIAEQGQAGGGRSCGKY